jgi:hypothetical protein
MTEPGVFIPLMVFNAAALFCTHGNYVLALEGKNHGEITHLVSPNSVSLMNK